MPVLSVVILGHSERRHVYGETDELVNRKVIRSLSEGFEVILCVGETLEERQKGVTENVVERQTRAGLSSVVERDLARVTIAYEPVWAIGTGQNATPQDADAVHRCIRRVMAGILQRGGGAGSDDTVRRVGQTRQYQGAHENGEHRRRSCRRCLLEG